jgi:hypothetical protein
MSLWEWNEVRKGQDFHIDPAHASWVARALKDNRALIERRASAGRLRDRRRLERQRQWEEARPALRRSERELIVSARLKDTPLPCEVLE